MVDVPTARTALGTTTHSWRTILSTLARGEELPTGAAKAAFTEIMQGRASDAQLAAFAVLIWTKIPTGNELAELVEVMLSEAIPVPLPADIRAIEITGTGGDGADTVNVSTMASLVVAATGIPVVKHGNRASSSRAGGADTLEAAGVDIDNNPAGILADLQRVGMAYCFARSFHPAMRFAGPVRAQLGVPTVFNALGPLTNPARPASAVIGCAFEDLLDPMAEVFAQRGDSVLVIRGDDGLDEITLTTTTQVRIVRDRQIEKAVIDPAAVGLELTTLDQLRGEPVEVFHAVLSGKQRGPVRDIVLLNAAAALVAHAGNATAANLNSLIAAQLPVAAEALDSGAANELLKKWAHVE